MPSVFRLQTGARLDLVSRGGLLNRQQSSDAPTEGHTVSPDQTLADRVAEVLRSLAVQEDLESSLRLISSSARTLTRSEAAFIHEIDEPGRSLTCLSASASRDTIPAALRLSVERSTAGQALREQRPIAASQSGTTGHGLAADDLALTSNTRTVLSVPLVVRGKALGTLQVANKDGSHYTEEDRAILETLAAPVALMLENASLQRRMDENSAAYSELDRLKTDFIAITSHELRTPLGLILGHATFLRELLDSQYREQVDVIVRNASRLKDIVESLSSMDNFKTGGARLRLQKFALSELVNEVVESYADLASKRGVELTLSPVPAELTLEADRTKLAIALGNLVRNAIAFTDAGGHVLVRCESLEGLARVSVTDDGVGIPAKDLPRIFERFFQVESHLTRHHGGMGLGLSVAKVMIEMHGGRIWAESTEGKGSVFSFLIPRKPEGDAGALNAPG